MPETIANGIALFLLWLFAVAGIRKLRAPAYYLKRLADYLPGVRAGRAVLYLVAAAELAVAVLLFVPGQRLAGLLGAVVLLMAYAVMMAWQYTHGHGDLQCGCAGPNSSLTVGPALVARNVVCALTALGAAAYPGGFSTSPGGIALALGVATVIITVYLYSDEVIAHAQAMDEDV